MRKFFLALTVFCVMIVGGCTNATADKNSVSVETSQSQVEKETVMETESVTNAETLEKVELEKLDIPKGIAITQNVDLVSAKVGEKSGKFVLRDYDEYNQVVEFVDNEDTLWRTSLAYCTAGDGLVFYTEIENMGCILVAKPNWRNRMFNATLNIYTLSDSGEILLYGRETYDDIEHALYENVMMKYMEKAELVFGISITSKVNPDSPEEILKAVIPYAKDSEIKAAIEKETELYKQIEVLNK